MKSIVVKLNEDKARAYKLAAGKLGISVEQYTELILEKLSLEDLVISESDITEGNSERVEPILSQEKYETLKQDILSDYAELYKRLA